MTLEQHTCKYVYVQISSVCTVNCSLAIEIVQLIMES